MTTPADIAAADLDALEALYAKTHHAVVWVPYDFCEVLTPEACAYVAALLNLGPRLIASARRPAPATDALERALRACAEDAINRTRDCSCSDREADIQAAIAAGKGVLK